LFSWIQFIIHAETAGSMYATVKKTLMTSSDFLIGIKVGPSINCVDIINCVLLCYIPNCIFKGFNCFAISIKLPWYGSTIVSATDEEDKETLRIWFSRAIADVIHFEQQKPEIDERKWFLQFKVGICCYGPWKPNSQCYLVLFISSRNNGASLQRTSFWSQFFSILLCLCLSTMTCSSDFHIWHKIIYMVVGQ